jgi:hypothetical protein
MCTADEFNGGHPALRRDLQARGMGYVLAAALQPPGLCVGGGGGEVVVTVGMW